RCPDHTHGGQDRLSEAGRLCRPDCRRRQPAQGPQAAAGGGPTSFGYHEGRTLPQEPAAVTSSRRARWCPNRLGEKTVPYPTICIYGEFGARLKEHMTITESTRAGLPSRLAGPTIFGLER